MPTARTITAVSHSSPSEPVARGTMTATAVPTIKAAQAIDHSKWKMANTTTNVVTPRPAGPTTANRITPIEIRIVRCARPVYPRSTIRGHGRASRCSREC